MTAPAYSGLYGGPNGGSGGPTNWGSSPGTNRSPGNWQNGASRWAGGGQQPNFSQMQQQGQARPAPPQSWYAGGSQGNGQGAPPSQPTSPQTPQSFAGAPPMGPSSPSGSGYGPSFAPPATQTYGSGYAATPQTQGNANALGTATQNLLLGQLNNPNPYAAPAVQAGLQQAQTQINEQQQQGVDAINSNLASRGVYDSSLASGYLQDINTQGGRQMASIGAGLLGQEAQNYAGGVNSALNNSGNYNANQFNQQATTAQINNQQQQAQQQYLLQMLGLTGT